MNLNCGIILNLDCGTILNLDRGTILNLDCGTILNFDCGTSLNLDCGTILNLKFRGNSIEHNLLKFSLKLSVSCFQHSLDVIYRPTNIDKEKIFC